MGDVAEVTKVWQQPADSLGYVDGRRTVFVASAAVPSVRLDRWQAEAEALLHEFRGELDDDIELTLVFEQNTYTNDRLSSLSGNLLLGVLVIMIVVLIALGWRAALIVGVALPLSASAALFGLTFFGQQIHQMTIFGLIIAIGLLIDNAVVVTDDIQKRLRAGVDRETAVAQATGHLMTPLFASTLTTILGFMPIFLGPGNIGDFVGPIAISVVLALSASFVISMTIIAALTGRFIPRPQGEPGQRRWWRAGLSTPTLANSGAALLRKLLARPLVAAGAALVLPIAGFALATTLKLEFFPTADRNQFEIEVWMPDEASIERTREMALDIEASLREFDGIDQVSWLVGGSHPQLYYNRIMKQDSNAAYAHAMVRTTTTARARELITPLREKLGVEFPQAQVIVAPLAQGPPVDAPLGFRLAGPSVDVLVERGAELRRIMHLVPAVTNTRATVTSRAKLSFAADQQRAELAGFSLDELSAQLQANLEGFVGGAIQEDLEELPVRVRYDANVRGSLEAIASMPLLPSSGGAWVPANALGEMELRPEQASITRRNGERVNVIYGWVRQGELPIEASNQVLQRLEKEGFTLPQGYSLSLEGDSDAQRDAVGSLTIYLPILIMLMATTLVLSFRSALSAAIIAIVAVLSAGLGLLSLWLSGFNLGFNPLLGTAGLIGVAINGAIVVLAALRADEQASRGDIDAVVAVTLGEARHVLATTATTIGGFLPLLLLSRGEFWPPLAVVMAGGVGFAVTLSLLFTPAVFTWLSRARPKFGRRVAPAAAVAAATLSGCAVGPDYMSPEPAVEGEWIEASEATTSALSNWWLDFDDPLLDEYVERARAENLDIAIATARLAEARALRRVARSRLLPQAEANASYTRFKQSEESQAFAAAGGGAPRRLELFDGGFDASWELDFFGASRRRLEAATAELRATEAETRATRLSITAEVVSAFAELRGGQRRLAVAENNARLQTETLDLVTRRVESGLAAELDRLNAEAQLQRTRATLPGFQAQIRSAALRLATLTTQPPEQVVAELGVQRGTLVAGSAVQPGLRGDVLRRRPDVIAQERRLAASSARIGAAIADRFPKFSLSGQFRWQAQDADRFGNDDTVTSAIVPGISLPLLAGGSLTANVDAAESRNDAALAAYERAVRRAIEESEAALYAYRRAEETQERLEVAVDASTEAATIARRLYESGLASFLAVLDAERRQLEAEDALAQQRVRTVLQLVAVYKAIGVG